MPSLKRAPSEKELKKLIGLFLKAETDIVNEIGRLRSLGLVDYHAVGALERVQRILRKLEDDCWEYAPGMVEKQFYVRVPEARRIEEPAEKHRKGYESAQALTSTQMDIVQRLTQNLMGEVTAANITVFSLLQGALLGRVEDDIFRRAGLEQAAQMEAIGRGAYRHLPDFVDALIREGVTCFVDKAGRKWSLHTYGAMVLRTTSRQAEILAVLTADPDHDLYKITSHKTTCKVCAPLEGRVYSRSGKDPVFPPLAAAFGKIDPKGPDDLSNSYLNIHPNCLHALVAWSPMGRSEKELEEIRKFSSFKKNPPAIDPRTKKQVEAYRKKEQARAAWLRDYRQWERYRVVLGDGVPRTFATFLKHKQAGGFKYKLWKLDYKRQNELLRHPEKALPGAAQATAAEAKFTKYFFNPLNEDGFKKGVAFTSHLGYNIDNWEKMRAEILSAAVKYPVVFKGEHQFGKRYQQFVVLQGLKRNPANMLIAWNVNPDGTAHMVSAYMEEVK